MRNTYQQPVTDTWGTNPDVANWDTFFTEGADGSALKGVEITATAGAVRVFIYGLHDKDYPGSLPYLIETEGGEVVAAGSTVQRFSFVGDSPCITKIIAIAATDDDLTADALITINPIS